jgi:hypothetical protein
MIGMGTSLCFMAMVWYKTPLAWTWYVLLGTLVCLIVGYTVSLLAPVLRGSHPITEVVE